MDPELAAYYLGALSDQPPLAPIRVSLTLSLPPPSADSDGFHQEKQLCKARTPHSHSPLPLHLYLRECSAPNMVGLPVGADAAREEHHCVGQRGAALGSNGTLDRRLPDAVGVSEEEHQVHPVGVSGEGGQQLPPRRLPNPLDYGGAAASPSGPGTVPGSPDAPIGSSRPGELDGRGGG